MREFWCPPFAVHPWKGQWQRSLLLTALCCFDGNRSTSSLEFPVRKVSLTPGVVNLQLGMLFISELAGAVRAI